VGKDVSRTRWRIDLVASFAAANTGAIGRWEAVLSIFCNSAGTLFFRWWAPGGNVFSHLSMFRSFR